MMSRILPAMRLLLPLAMLISPAFANAGENPLKIELISEARTIRAGKPFFLGLHLEHPPGTHTYWKYPGIVGISTTVEWQLPQGFKAGEIQWPAPQIVKMAGHQAQGYEGETLLLVPITPPEHLAGPTAIISAKVSWMCCGKTCNPAVNVPLSITLPISIAEEIDPATRSLFAKFRSMVPSPDPRWKTTVVREREKIILTLRPPIAVSKAESYHFFTSDGQVDSGGKQNAETLPDGAIRLTLPRGDTRDGRETTLPGVIGFEDSSELGSQMFHLEIDAAY